MIYSLHDLHALPGLRAQRDRLVEQLARIGCQNSLRARMRRAQLAALTRDILAAEARLAGRTITTLPTGMVARPHCETEH